MKLSNYIFPVLFLLSGCGGGGSGLTRLETHPVDTQGYSGPAYQHPSYTPHATPSYIHHLGDTVYIGGDVEPREKLRKWGSVENIDYFIGASRDGVGVNRLENVLVDLTLSGGDLNPFIVQPQIYLTMENDEEESDWLTDLGLLVWNSVSILNDALPPEFQIEVNYSEEIPLFAAEGDIVVQVLSPAEISTTCGEGAIACASPNIIGNLFTRDAKIFIPDDLHTDECSTFCPHSARATIVHELMHALGVRGHVDHIEFPDSLMSPWGDFFPNLGFTIHRLDREALQIMYMSQRTDIYNDWGEWSDNSLHLVGIDQDEQVHFGVALFNGLPQPWARGEIPDTALTNLGVSGLVSWAGALLGFSGPSAVAGGASLEVNLATVMDSTATHDLKFTDLYFVNRFENMDPWFPTRNINYQVSLDADSNTFWYSPSSVLDTEGLIRGSFFGSEHEAMGGTLKRTDLVGAFGGTK